MQASEPPLDSEHARYDHTYFGDYHDGDSMGRHWNRRGHGGWGNEDFFQVTYGSCTISYDAIHNVWPAMM